MQTAILNKRSSLSRLAKAVALATSTGLLAQAPPSALSPNLAGIAHVAFRVADLGVSLKFYESLGYEKSFELSRDGKVYEAFIKVSDHQFIELYPVDQTETQPEFMHICFEGKDLAAVRLFYLQHGLHPTEITKGGAGNLLFSMSGPATPTGPQVIEYTQYLPGSMHSKDAGQHLGDMPFSTKMVSVSLAFDDPTAARSLYLDQAGFRVGARHELLIPGTHGDSVSMASHKDQGFAGRVTFESGNRSTTRTEMAKRGLHPVDDHGLLKLVDPDGTVLLFRSR